MQVSLKEVDGAVGLVADDEYVLYFISLSDFLFYKSFFPLKYASSTNRFL